MPDGKRPKWPQTPGGTTDWESVFEDPGKGFIPLILGSSSANELRQRTIDAIGKLFTRKDDPPEVAHFTDELTEMIPDDLGENLLPKMAEAVADILRDIKDHRKTKAAEFEAAKKAEAEAAAKAEKEGKKPPEKKERRRPDPPDKKGGIAKGAKGKGKKKKHKPLTPKQRNVLLGAGGAALVAILVAVIVLTRGPTELTPEMQLIEQMKAAAAGEKVPPIHSFGGTLKVGFVSGHKAVIVYGVPKDACAGTAWVFVNRGNVMINGMMPTRVSPNILAELCGRAGPDAELAWFPKKEPKKDSKKEE